MNKKFIMYDGHRFCRDDKTGYYLSSFPIWNGQRIRLHRYVYQKYFGEIPEGYEVHHKDFNKDNNSIENLELIQRGEHQRLHGKYLTKERKEWLRKNLLRNAVPASKKWHRSNEGHKWHSEHARKVMESQCETKVRKTCEYCGKDFFVPAYVAARTRFCSNKCKSAYRRERGIDNEVRKCAYCGKEFTVNKYSKTTYCSKSCAAKSRWMERRKGKED